MIPSNLKFQVIEIAQRMELGREITEITFEPIPKQDEVRLGELGQIDFLITAPIVLSTNNAAIIENYELGKFYKLNFTEIEG